MACATMVGCSGCTTYRAHSVHVRIATKAPSVCVAPGVSVPDFDGSVWSPHDTPGAILSISCEGDGTMDLVSPDRMLYTDQLGQSRLYDRAGQEQNYCA